MSVEGRLTPLRRVVNLGFICIVIAGLLGAFYNFAIDRTSYLGILERYPDATEWANSQLAIVAFCFAAGFVAPMILSWLMTGKASLLPDWSIVDSKKKPKSLPQSEDVDIIKGEKLKKFSVAEELTKWAKLKEDGHITEEEYNKAREKLLK